MNFDGDTGDFSGFNSGMGGFSNMGGFTGGNNGNFTFTMNGQ
jgi:hypothetical protein